MLNIINAGLLYVVHSLNSIFATHSIFELASGECMSGGRECVKPQRVNVEDSRVAFNRFAVSESHAGAKRLGSLSSTIRFMLPS